jgi:hypothetical protein
VTVPTVDDTDDEFEEEFFLELTELTGPGEPVIGTATITDNDPARLSIADASIVEGTGGTTVARFEVTATTTDGGFTVQYATEDGTATSPLDYAATPGTLTFVNGGELTQTIDVPVVADAVEETSETFVVRLSGASPNALISDGQATGTILDDDAVPPPAVSSAPTVSNDTGPSPTVQTRVLRGLTLVPSKRRLRRSSLLRLNGVLRVSGGPASCRSRQKIAIQRRKANGRFQTFEVAVTNRAGSFRTSTRPGRTYVYRARVSQTARCMGASSKAAKVTVRKRSKRGSARR